MSSDWVTGAFTLAGSIVGAGLTGTLTLATTKAQRRQTTAQIKAADAQRAQEIRRDGYTRLIAAASALRSAWRKVLDQHTIEITESDEVTRGDPALETSTDLHRQLHGLRVELEQAVANVQLLGPADAVRSSEAVRDRFLHLDHLSNEWFSDRREGKTDHEIRYYQLHADVFYGCADTLDEFASAARTALGLA